MRTFVLATCGALLLIGGVWTAVFTAAGGPDLTGDLGPAVQIGSTSVPTISPTTPAGPSVTPSGNASTDDHGVHEVSPSPAVEVGDDHGGGRGGKGKSGG